VETKQTGKEKGKLNGKELNGNGMKERKGNNEGNGKI
jgi:hypothetical protein